MVRYLAQYEGLILCHVVGRLEVKVHHVLELLPSRSQEQDPHSGTLFTQGAVEEGSPMWLNEDQSFDLQLVVIWTLWLAWRWCLVYHKVSWHLTLNCMA
jgi:hypothetical protein